MTWKSIWQMSVPKGLERVRLLQRQVEQRVEKFTAARRIQIRLVGAFSFGPGAQGIHGEISEVPAIVIVTCGKGVEATSETVDGGIKAKIIIVGEDDVKVAIENG